jgi:hypothetical protein
MPLMELPKNHLCPLCNKWFDCPSKIDYKSEQVKIFGCPHCGGEFPLPVVTTELVDPKNVI